jgi:nitric oxide reductase large subunit
MGRILVIVAVLVAVALLIRAYLPKTDAEKKEVEQVDAPASEVSSPAPVTEATSPVAVVLGEGDLLMGIPGEGELTLTEIDA